MADFDIEKDVREALDLYGDSVLRLAYSYLHNLQEAEDMLQETMIKYVTSRPVFESESHRKAWLLRVAANLSKNRIEYNRVRDCDEITENTESAVPAEPVEPADSPYSGIWEAVKKLPPSQREAVHLFYQEGYSTAEIARITERKESTVRSDLRRARLGLKKILSKEADNLE